VPIAFPAKPARPRRPAPSRARWIRKAISFPPTAGSVAPVVLRETVVRSAPMLLQIVPPMWQAAPGARAAGTVRWVQAVRSVPDVMPPKIFPRTCQVVSGALAVPGVSPALGPSSAPGVSPAPEEV
jgi:hypothetical protein